MSILSQVTKGKVVLPPRLIVYGVEKIGKSTLAAGAENPIFITTEQGTNEIACSRLPLAIKLQQVMDALAALSEEKHDFSTVVIDSIDWLEKLIFDATCEKFGVSSIEKVDGGYGKGYGHALVFWREILNALDYLRSEKGMSVILIAHSKVEKFEDPESAASYDRYSLKLNKHSGALLSEWADAILFATRKIIIQVTDGGFNKKRATAAGLGADGGERVLKCVGGPSCVAGNRYSLPAEIPLSWDKLSELIAKSQEE